MKSTLTENTGPQLSWCWIYSILFISWAAFCITTAAFFVYGSIQDSHARFIQYSNAYSEHVYDKTSSNQIILEGFAALSAALGNTNTRETARYARQIMARHPHILSLDIIEIARGSALNTSENQQHETDINDPSLNPGRWI